MRGESGWPQNGIVLLNEDPGNLLYRHFGNPHSAGVFA